MHTWFLPALIVAKLPTANDSVYPFPGSAMWIAYCGRKGCAISIKIWMMSISALLKRTSPTAVPAHMVNLAVSVNSNQEGRNKEEVSVLLVFVKCVHFLNFTVCTLVFTFSITSCGDARQSQWGAFIVGSNDEWVQVQTTFINHDNSLWRNCQENKIKH